MAELPRWARNNTPSIGDATTPMLQTYTPRDLQVGASKFGEFSSQTQNVAYNLSMSLNYLKKPMGELRSTNLYREGIDWAQRLASNPDFINDPKELEKQLSNGLNQYSKQASWQFRSPFREEMTDHFNRILLNKATEKVTQERKIAIKSTKSEIEGLLNDSYKRAGVSSEQPIENIIAGTTEGINLINDKYGRFLSDKEIWEVKRDLEYRLPIEAKVNSIMSSNNSLAEQLEGEKQLYSDPAIVEVLATKKGRDIVTSAVERVTVANKRKRAAEDGLVKEQEKALFNNDLQEILGIRNQKEQDAALVKKAESINRTRGPKAAQPFYQLISQRGLNKKGQSIASKEQKFAWINEGRKGQYTLDQAITLRDSGAMTEDKYQSIRRGIKEKRQDLTVEQKSFVKNLYNSHPEFNPVPRPVTRIINGATYTDWQHGSGKKDYDAFMRQKLSPYLDLDNFASYTPKQYAQELATVNEQIDKWQTEFRTIRASQSNQAIKEQKIEIARSRKLK